MHPVAIRTTNLGKRYAIGTLQRRHDTLRDQLADGLGDLLRHVKNARHRAPDRNLDSIWALKHLSLEIERGDVVGIIGRNGAGKTTLLKILSRITEPTEGRAEIRGRVGSLLEVGTGFHPELTGRENIYLNGAILGMKKHEIDRQFDEIVDFAETERFLDTPVKRYSSGMYVRLAFAVAAHLDPEILLVDEVLAVGDLDFQAKCFGKMGSVSREGRTVLLVSHNMGAVMALCQKALLLEDGQATVFGPTGVAVQQHIGVPSAEQCSLLRHPGRANGLAAHVSEVKILGGADKSESTILCGDVCEIVAETVTPLPSRARFAIGIYDAMGTPISHVGTELARRREDASLWANQVLCRIDQLNLAPGSYYINVAFSDGDVMLDHITRAKWFRVIDSNFLGMGRLPSGSCAKVMLRHEWSYGTRLE